MNKSTQIQQLPMDDVPFREGRLCVVGNINRDVKTAPFSADARLFNDGETTVPAIEETLGGGGANSASAAAALGATCHFIGQVGADPLGDRLEQALLRAGVHPHLRRAPDLASGTTINLVYASGARHFLSCHPNNRALRFEDLDLAALSAAEHLYRADLWFSEPMLFDGNRRLLAAARQLGLATSIDVNWDPAWGEADAAEIRRRKEAVRDLLPLVDLVHGNLRELCEFTDAGSIDAAIGQLLAAGAGAVVLHHGAQGAGYFSRTEQFIEPPAPVTNPLRATGTGDVLSVCVMLLHRRSELNWPARLRMANRVVAEFMEGRLRLIPRLEDPA